VGAWFGDACPPVHSSALKRTQAQRLSARSQQQLCVSPCLTHRAALCRGGAERCLVFVLCGCAGAAGPAPSTPIGLRPLRARSVHGRVRRGSQRPDFHYHCAFVATYVTAAMLRDLFALPSEAALDPEARPPQAQGSSLLPSPWATLGCTASLVPARHISITTWQGMAHGTARHASIVFPSTAFRARGLHSTAPHRTAPHRTAPHRIAPDVRGVPRDS